MLLTIDVGNTNITFGIFGENGPGVSKYVPSAQWRITTDPVRMPDEYGLLMKNLLALKNISLENLDAVAICSVVPPLTPAFVDVCKTHFKLNPLVVGAGVKTGIRVLYDNPRDVGSDRVADAVAALELYGGPVIVVDFGTATVFDAISSEGEYMGGAIAPGLSVAADGLFHSTSQLRRVELEIPTSAIGKNTIHAIQSGLMFGYTEMVKGMVTRFNDEIGGGSKIIGTGGFAELIAIEAGIFDAVNPELTLAGLRIIHDLNHKT